MGFYDFFKKHLRIEENPERDDYIFDNYFQKEEDIPCENNAKKKEYKRNATPYKYVLFSEYADTSYIVGSRNDFMRQDYTIEPEYYVKCQYIHHLWRLSKDLEKTVKNKKFFEIYEELQDLLGDIENYKAKNFSPQLEIKRFNQKIDEVMTEFVEKSFRDVYRNALELKTPKGRVGRIDNWFLQMNYYKNYLRENALQEFEHLQKQWNDELSPALAIGIDKLKERKYTKGKIWDAYIGYLSDGGGNRLS